MILTQNYSVGRPKHLQVMAGAVEGGEFVGQKAEQLRGLLKYALKAS
jgi:centractin